MQLTLIFTTLVTFAAIAVSHPTPKLVKARTSLDEPQKLNPSTIDYDIAIIANAFKLDTPNSVDFGDTLASRRPLDSDASGEADHNETPTSLAGRQEPVAIDWDYSVLNMPKALELTQNQPTSRDGVHKALTPDKPDTLDSVDFGDTLASPRRSLNSVTSAEANHNDDIDNDVHKISSQDSKLSISHSINERQDGNGNGEYDGDVHKFSVSHSINEREDDESGDGGDGRDGSDFIDNDVHKRKAFVYRLKDEKRYN
ncbi:hypothetical protein EV424DRAFT_1422556 [Suillus variegatus]|nr:hypothetical protein EV424DRAFT_1422556 [Suillus variegatus]